MKNKRNKNMIKYSTIRSIFDSNLDNNNIKIFRMVNDNIKKKGKKILLTIPKEITKYNWIFIVGIKKNNLSE